MMAQVDGLKRSILASSSHKSVRQSVPGDNFKKVLPEMLMNAHVITKFP